MASIHIEFDTNKIPIDEIREIEKIFQRNGISFDTGQGAGWRDWFIEEIENSAMQIYVQ